MEAIKAWNIPVMPLRGLVVFPHMRLTFDVERRISIAALERAMAAEQEIFIVTQRDAAADTPGAEDLFTVGTVSHISQILRLSSVSVRVMVEGRKRAFLRNVSQKEPFLQAIVEEMEEPELSEASRNSARTEALLRQTWGLFREYAEKLSGNIAEEIVTAALDCRDPGYLADFITQNIILRHTDKQEILEEAAPLVRLKKVNNLLARECSVLNFEQEMEHKVRENLAQGHREQILRTQIRVLQNELGEDSDEEEELEAYRERIEEIDFDEETERHLLKEVNKLARQPYGSAESGVIRNYLDICLDLPWNIETKERLNVEAARKVLEKDHFGLEKVKERILETIAVRQMNPEGKGQILCLVGPPGVGKTSIAISVAKALNRKLARVSLGGVRDEADIRGHRKTYVGSMPGRIIEAISRGGSMNPLLLLDEIDKLGNDYRGDPASALLEVLDSEQNIAFRDHFLEIPVDLSRVMFITTANNAETIPTPLLDRMEIIELSSYTDEEKIQIAKRHLLPKQLKAHGLKKNNIKISDDVLRAIIRDYTRESGVRLLERRLAAICRKIDMRIIGGDVKRVNISESDLPKFLDCQPYPPSPHTDREEIGVVNGLAWTETGGEILEVEVNVMEGSGKLELTGNLGDVMKESASAALSCLRSRVISLGIEPEFYKNKDIHVHFPEGAIPKDGPSAGIAMATAILSALTGRKIKSNIAMTGEVTLRGRVLAIGGLKEKTMAAKRFGIQTVLIPKDNLRDLEEIDQTVRAALNFIPVETVDQVFDAALIPIPVHEGEALKENDYPARKENDFPSNESSSSLPSSSSSIPPLPSVNPDTRPMTQ